MNIVYVITGLSMGGAERQVCLLADKMVERGHQVVLISLGSNAKNLPGNDKVTVHQLGMSKNPVSFLTTYIKLKKIIQESRPNVLHSHLFHANIICRLIKLTTNIPRLISSSHSRYEGGKMRMMLYRLTSGLCDVITNVSQDAVNENIRQKIAPSNKIISVANGIDTQKICFNNSSRKKIIDEFSFSENNIILLSVGRFTEAKDYPTLLLAFKQLITKNENLRLLVVGNGELFDTLSALRKKLGLEKFVSFTGIRSDVSDFMSAADVYVMSSAWEGLPLVIGEAMSCNCLIVTTNCGGVAEILGDCGLVVPVGNPNLLADGILKQINLNDNERFIIKNKARARVESKFSIETVVDKWLGIYTE